MTTPTPKLTRSVSMREEAPLEPTSVRVQSLGGDVSPRQLIRHYTVTQSVDNPLADVHTSLVEPVQKTGYHTKHLDDNLMGNNSITKSASVVRLNDFPNLSSAQKSDVAERQLFRHDTSVVDVPYLNTTYVDASLTQHVHKRLEGSSLSASAVQSFEAQRIENPVVRFAHEADEELLPLRLAFILAALACSGFALGLGLWTLQPPKKIPEDSSRNSSDPQCALLQKALNNVKEESGYGSAEDAKTTSSKEGGALAKMKLAWFKTQKKRAQNNPPHIPRSYETQSATEAYLSPEYINGTMIEKKGGTPATEEEQELRAKALATELQQGRL
jgi:hypothetical protein